MLSEVPYALVILAHRMAESSRAIARRYFRCTITVDNKSDKTPVTVVDREIEYSLRSMLHNTVPEHGIIGEEYGSENVTAEWVWVLDPIDGTKAFITGKPSFGTLIGLMWHGYPVLGLIDQPITGERWIGGCGVPACMNGKSIRVRPCTTLGFATLYTTDPDMFQDSQDSLSKWKKLERTVKLRRFGADCYAYGLLAAGLIDLVYECQLKAYDYLPVIALIESAGGIVTDGNGNPVSLDSNICILASGDQRVHTQALNLLL